MSSSQDIDKIYIVASVYKNKGSYTQAIDLFRTVENRSPGYKDVYALLQETYELAAKKDISERNYPSALLLIKKSLALSPSDYVTARLLSHKAFCEYHIGYHERSVITYQKAVSLCRDVVMECYRTQLYELGWEKFDASIDDTESLQHGDNIVSIQVDTTQIANDDDEFEESETHDFKKLKTYYLSKLSEKDNHIEALNNELTLYKHEIKSLKTSFLSERLELHSTIDDLKQQVDTLKNLQPESGTEVLAVINSGPTSSDVDIKHQATMDTKNIPNSPLPRISVENSQNLLVSSSGVIVDLKTQQRQTDQVFFDALLTGSPTRAQAIERLKSAFLADWPDLVFRPSMKDGSFIQQMPTIYREFDRLRKHKRITSIGEQDSTIDTQGVAENIPFPAIHLPLVTAPSDDILKFIIPKSHESNLIALQHNQSVLDIQPGFHNIPQKQRENETISLIPNHFSDVEDNGIIEELKIDDKYSQLDIDNKLDKSQIQLKQLETEKVSRLLRDIFFDESEPELAVTNIPSLSGSLNLDEIHTAFLLVLTTKELWSRNELERLAAGKRLLLEGVLHTINEEVFEVYGEPLFEGEDPIELNTEIIQQVKSNFTLWE